MDVTLQPLDKQSNAPVCFDVHQDQKSFIGPTSFVPCEVGYVDEEAPYLIKKRGAVVGYVSVVMRNFEDGVFPYVGQLIIDKKHQRQGFGKRAMEILIADLRGKSISREVRISTSECNEAAIGLYLGVGFLQAVLMRI